MNFPTSRASGASLLLATVMLGLTAIDATAQNCNAMPPQSDFEITEVGPAPGMAMDIAAAKDGRIFWVERHGNFKVWNPTTKAVTTIHKFETLSTTPGASMYYLAVETGVQGIALDPAFADNHWVYIRYSVPANKQTGLSSHNLGPIEKLSRFTLKTNDTQIDLATEKTLLEFKVYAQCCHFGGDLEWGPDGTLWTATGDNIHYEYTNPNPYQDGNAYSDVRSTSGNTNDLRGKVLRIRPIKFPDSQTPTPGIGSTYEIPAGNLFPVGTDKTRPEIFSMGHRNPFSVAVHHDPSKVWAATGEAGGLSEGGGEDEVNIMTKPGFYGWPYFNGNNVPYRSNVHPGGAGVFSNPAAVTNNSRHNTGASVLPPAIPATLSPVTGKTLMPMVCLGVTWGWVKHDPTLNSPAKWPAFLDGKLLVSSHGVAQVKVATVDASGNVTRLDNLFAGSPFTTDVMKATQGADGAFYVAKGDALNFGASTASRIYRVAYKGPCFTVGVKKDAAFRAALMGRRDRVANLGNTQVAFPAGARSLTAFAMDGRQVWTSRRADDAREALVSIPSNVTRGMLEIRYAAD